MSDKAKPQTMAARWRLDREQFAREMAQMMNWEPSKWVLLEPFVERVQRAAIEAMRNDQLLSDVCEFVKGISEDTYTQGVPWRRAQTLLERIDAALKELP